MKQQFSLRGHKAAITHISSLDSDIVSSDRDGWVVVWNLTTRRPRALWRAHGGHVLTLQQTPHGLLTHGRDSSIKIWKTDPEILLLCCSDASVLGTSARAEGPLHVEIPVNSLNFSNVDLFGDLLVTPATVDSDNFDVYKLEDPFGTLKLSRVLENVAICSVAQKCTDIEEVNSPVGRGGQGIIMQLKFISERLLFIAYESGAVFGLAIEPQTHDTSSKKDRTILFKPYKVSKVFLVNDHKPLPALSLEYDSQTKKLFTGSASKKLHVYNLAEFENLTSQPESYNLRHYGIQCLQILADRYVVGFWDGVVKGYAKDFSELFLLERPEEAIKPTFVGKQIPEKKSLCIYSRSPAERSGLILNSRKETLHLNRFGTGPLLFIGYGDGLITAFK